MRKARARALTCKRGHDTSQPWQRYSDGHCRTCQQNYVASQAYDQYRMSSAGQAAAWQAQMTRKYGASESPDDRQARLAKPGWREDVAARQCARDAAIASGAAPGDAFKAVFLAAYKERTGHDLPEPAVVPNRSLATFFEAARAENDLAIEANLGEIRRLTSAIRDQRRADGECPSVGSDSRDRTRYCQMGLDHPGVHRNARITWPNPDAPTEPVRQEARPGDRNYRLWEARERAAR